MLLSWSPELLCLTARRFHSARGLSPSPAAQCQGRWDSEVQPRLGLGQSQGDLESCSCPLPGMRPVPLQPRMLAKLLLYSQCWGLPRVPVHQLSDCRSAGGRREALPAHFTACVWLSFPFPPWPGPKAYPSCPSFHSRAPSLGPDSLSYTRVRSTSPGSAPACHHCPLWSARMDMAVGSGGWLAGAGLLVLRPARDPGQRCRLPLTCAQGWFFSNEGQSPQRGNRL